MILSLPSPLQTALLLTAIWLALVVVRFHRSPIVLVAGLFGIGAYTLAALAYGKVTLAQLGFGPAHFMAGNH